MKQHLALSQQVWALRVQSIRVSEAYDDDTVQRSMWRHRLDNETETQSEANSLTNQ